MNKKKRIPSNPRLENQLIENELCALEAMWFNALLAVKWKLGNKSRKTRFMRILPSTTIQSIEHAWTTQQNTHTYKKILIKIWHIFRDT